MQKNLVIVESPAKAKTIEKFLGDDYKVVSSYGHIRDLKKKSFSIDTDTFVPQYEIPADKAKLVSELKNLASKAQTVWLASDEDREGEAISWHLQQVLGLKPENTRRIVFHEITKQAILAAIENPRDIDINLVNAQQARRVLDRIVGFKLSPVLWKKVRPSLSAGRVQSVAVRLIVEREREVLAFKSKSSYRIIAEFNTAGGQLMRAELTEHPKTKDEAMAILESLKDASFTVEDVQKKPVKRSPQAPFTTSTLQQDAAHKLGFTVSQTMRVAQKLYEDGNITYMRTDSVNLSTLALGASKQVILEQMGDKYVHTRNYHTSSKGAQEAHEAIRPTYMDRATIDGTSQERRLYELIYKRTLACQMADAELEKTTITINTSDGRQFVANGEVIKFDGFLRVYRDIDAESEETMILPAVAKGEALERGTITAQERWSPRPQRYNEATLVRKLEELGIGRPSTYAPTISTIQQREYVVRGDKAGDEMQLCTLTLIPGKPKISEKTKTTMVGAERARLLPTDTGIVVNDFLLQYFPNVMDYNFTAEAEKEFDEIAEGHTEWHGMMVTFYNELMPIVDRTMTARDSLKVGERVLGEEPGTGLTVSVKIGRFGPVVQIGTANDADKPRFARLGEGQSIETITLEEALELFRLPKTLGEHEGKTVTVASGRFGPYVSYDGQFASVPKGTDPMSVTLEDALALIEAKREAEAKRHLKTFEEDPDMEIMNGRFGPYILYKGENYRIPKAMHEKATELSYLDCLRLVQEEASRPTKKKTTRK